MTALARDNGAPDYSLKPLDLGKVAVLMGGLSAEREVSLKSGAAVLSALQQKNVDAHGVDVGENIIETLQAGNFDRAFIILHGRGGEDGVIQAVLETLRIPFTGSGVLGSALCMDKIKSKQVWHAEGLSTPHFIALNEQSHWSEVSDELGLPIAVKPVREGSSLGTTRVDLSENLEDAWRVAAEFDDEVMAEPWVEGDEYTVAILAGKSLPVIRLDTPREFYDYAAKYESSDTSYHCPSGLDTEMEQRVQKIALRAFHVLGARAWGRIDLIIDKAGHPGCWKIILCQA